MRQFYAQPKKIDSDEKTIFDQQTAFDEIRKDASNVRFCSNELLEDKKFYMSVLEQNWESKRPMVYGKILTYAPLSLLADKDFISYAIQKGDAYSFDYASKELKIDKDYVSQLLDIHWAVLEYASDEIKEDEEIVLKAVTRCGRAIRFTSEKFRDNDRIAAIAIEKSPEAICFLSPRLQEKYSKPVLTTISSSIFSSTKDTVAQPEELNPRVSF